MTKIQKVSLAALRVVLGWLFFYAGITKVMNPEWTSAGYLKAAKTFPEMYSWFLQPNILPIIDFVNEWGLTLLGISLILGIFVRLSSVLGSLLMLMYYLPILKFPYPNPNSYIVDQHIVFIFVMLYFATVGAGRYFGLDSWCASLPICSKFPKLRKLIG